MPGRPRRRAVGPPGATPPGPEPRFEPPAGPSSPDSADPVAADDERLRRERPPHHDRER